MSTDGKRAVAYIVSMQHGLDTWTFRELEALEDALSIHVFPLRYGNGPYMPKPDWYCHRFRPWRIAVQQPWRFLRQPRRYVRLLAEAVRTRSVTDLLLAFDFAQAMAARNVALIHCVYGDHKFFIGYYCHKLLGIPLSVALYGYDLRANPNWRMFRRAIGVTDSIVVNCDFNRRLLADIAGEEHAARAQVIRHYAEIPAYEQRDAVRVLIVGGFSERKGHDVLFKAIHALGADAEGVEVWVAGYPGPVDVVKLAQECGVADKVVVFGSVADQGLRYLFEHCDIFCLPSKTDRHGVSEGLPVALIEAMSYGKPVISTRLAGIPELVEDILIDEGDVQGLAAAIKRLVDDEGLRAALGARNLEIVKERYSARNAQQMRALLLQTIDAAQAATQEETRQ